MPLSLPVALAGLIGLVLCARNPLLRERIALAWKLRTAGSDASASAHAAALSYRRMLHLLEKRGWRKSPQQTPLEFATALPSGAIATPVSKLTEIYQASRFGNRPIDMATLSSLLAAVQTALKQ
jgi:hypothetical protein